MRIPNRLSPFLAALACAGGLVVGSAALAADPVPMSGPKYPTELTNKMGVPGERTCFWAVGPFGGDPYQNVAYPETNTIYWGAKFTTPEGAKLRLDGQFAHSRYTSYTTYDDRGLPVETLADYLITPLPGHTNPARHGADRTVTKRSYSIDVTAGGMRDTTRAEGFFHESTTAKTIAAPKNGGTQQVIVLRNYLSDKGLGITGGVPLPAPVLTLADGTELRGAAACKALNTSQLLKISPDSFGIPIARYRELLTLPGKPDTHPATLPSTWYSVFGRKEIEGLFTGEIVTGGRKSEGFYPTVDNQYIRTFTNRKFGPVYVMRGTMPSTPKTVNGDKVMNTKDADLRYWSICSQRGFANTTVVQCLHDEEMVTFGPERNYIIAFSRASDRPRSAYAECGINWLVWPDDGDGMFDPDQGNLIIRNMLARPDFAHSIQKVTKPGEERQVMGSYLPTGFYLNKDMFEAAFTCRSKAEQASLAKQAEEADTAQQAAAKAK
ncbi:hypothetical protein [Hydrogenophaga sp.]|uniref:hypothetical protein n=1 Tax=Hydrogenophaga sp. TaxID=1904254 RepID=UPI00286E5D96|nr:hypothetical protein [Hydrogenophaga sp.]